MQAICAALQNESGDAARLCDWILSNGFRVISEIDTGVETIDFVSQPAHVEIIGNTRGDGVLNAQEIFSSVIDLLEGEEMNAVSSFSFSSFERIGFTSQNTSFVVPWLLSENSQLINQISSRLTNFKSELRDSGLEEGSREFNFNLAEKIASYIVDPEGLNVRRSVIALQEWTAEEALTSSHQADCSEFSMIFYELSRLAGLDANIINVIKNSSGIREYHFLVGLRLNPGAPNEITFVDLTKSNPFIATPPQEWVFAPKLSMVAYYHMNLGLMPPQSVVNTGDEARFQYAENQYRIGLNYDPDLPLLHYNMGKLYKCAGLNYNCDLPLSQYNLVQWNDQLSLAESYFKRSLELDPDDPQTANELSSLTFIGSQ